MSSSSSGKRDGERAPAALRPMRRTALIWQMLGLAVVVHLALLLGLSPKLFTTDEQSPEKLFERGQTEFAQGRYTEAMALYQRVMELQPKIPPVFEKAAEQHRIAERLLQRSDSVEPATQTATGNGQSAPAGTNPDGSVTTKPSPQDPPARSTQPATGPDFVPPELGGK